jgi:hypothetical protein
MTICTIDVHSRDVVAKMITAKVENASAFQWQSQLRHRYRAVPTSSVTKTFHPDQIILPVSVSRQ